jgi:acetolactate synthase-1/2/3 large subunit
MFFCEVVLTPGYEFAPKLSSQRLPDGKIVSKSLEDMYPFLSDEEMARNVYHR